MHSLSPAVRFAFLCSPLALALLLSTACSSSEEPPSDAPPSASGTEPPPEVGPPAPPDAPSPGPVESRSASDSKGCGSQSALAKPGPASGLAITASGKKRNYALSVPTGYDAQRAYPLVFVLHGGGGNGSSTRDYFRFESFAGDKAVFVYPDGEYGSWELDAPAAQNKDVALFDALVADLGAKLCVDTTRVFATGYSMGAYLANQLGCRRGNVLRAIAPHAGGGPWESNGKYTADGRLDCGQKPVAAMIFIGLADDTVNPGEGAKSLAHWTYASGCETQTSAVTPGPCVAHSGCKQPVVSCKIPGLGHDIWSEGAKATWDFFAKL